MSSNRLARLKLGANVEREQNVEIQSLGVVEMYFFNLRSCTDVNGKISSTKLHIT
jgi:hypothetical protein